MDPSQGLGDSSIETEATEIEEKKPEDEKTKLKQDLGLPETQEAQDSSEQETGKNVEGAEEQESIELRQEFVDQYIEDSIEQMYTEWDSYLSQCENKDKAKNIIAEQTRDAITQKTAGYIEQGGDPSVMDFHAILSIGYYDIGGTRKQFVTKFKINVGSQYSATSKEEDEFHE